MAPSRHEDSESCVTYRWLLTTTIASAASILAIVGAIANITFYSKSAGAAVEEQIKSTQMQIVDMKAVIQEIRIDVKSLIARKD